MVRTIRLSALFLKENDSWVGQCLERDMAAQGKTLSDAKDALKRAIAGQIFIDAMGDKEPLGAMQPAPAFYQTKFAKAERLKFAIEFESLVANTTATIDDVRVLV